MIEKNKPEEEVKIEKKKRDYIHLEDSEILDLINIYRKLLKVELASERDLIISKIELLEKELKHRNKLVKTKAE